MKQRITALISFYSVVVYLARQAAWRNESFKATLEYSRATNECVNCAWTITLQASDQKMPDKYITSAHDTLYGLMGIVAGMERVEEGEGWL